MSGTRLSTEAPLVPSGQRGVPPDGNGGSTDGLAVHRARLGESASTDPVPLVVPTRGHLDDVRLLLRGDYYVG